MSTNFCDQFIPSQNLFSFQASTQSAMAPQSSQPPDRNTIFDILPTEICSRIAQFMPDEPSQRRNLASICPNFRHAILEQMQYQLTLDITCNRRTIQEWAQAVGRDVLELYVDKPVALNAPSILQMASLRHVSIPIDRGCLKAIARSTTITSLTLRHGTLPQGDEKILYQTMSALDQIRQFRVVTFQRSETINGLFHHACRTGFFPQLDRLDLEVFRDSSFPRLAHLLPAFPKLREITLDGDVRLADVLALRALDTVRLRNQENFDAAVYTGPSLKELQSFETVRLGQLDHSVFPGLETLSLPLKPRVERFLACILNSLTSLDLTWINAYENGAHNKFYAPSPGKILRVVENNPHMKVLQLFEIKLCRSELTKMLETLGNSLEVFGVSIEGQDELQIERLEFLLQTALEFNASLRDLQPHWDYVSREHNDIFDREELVLGRMTGTLARLERSAPKFNSFNVERFLSSNFSWKPRAQRRNSFS